MKLKSRCVASLIKLVASVNCCYLLRLKELGAECIVCRHNVDAEDQQTIDLWLNAVMKILESLRVDAKLDYLCSLDFEDIESDGPNREHPYMSILKVCLLSPLLPLLC